MQGIDFNSTDIQITYIHKTLHKYLLPYLTSFNGGCFIIELFFKKKILQVFQWGLRGDYLRKKKN